MKRKYGKQILKDLLNEELDEQAGLREVSVELAGKTRWHLVYNLIFHDANDNTYWHTTYSVGATEYQDAFPFDDAPDEVECSQVVPVEKTVVVYKDKATGKLI